MIEAVLGYKSSWRILQFLAQTPKKPISKVEIKKYTYLGNEGVILGLKRLVLSNILISEKKGRKEFYYFNLDNSISLNILDMISIENKRLRFLDYKTKIVLEEFSRKIIEKISDVEKISIFGSRAKGIQKKDSDIDIALLLNEKNIKNELMITNLVDIIENQFNVTLEVHYFSKQDFSNKNNNLIKEVIEDEIILFEKL